MSMVLSLRFIHMCSLNGFGHTGATGLTCCNATNVKKTTLLGWREYDDLFNHEYDYRPNWTRRCSVTN